MTRISFIVDAFIGMLFCFAVVVEAEAVEPNGNNQFREPVFRVAKNLDEKAVNQQPQKIHPLDEPLRIAMQSLAHIRKDIADYTATLVKRERVNNKLGEPEFTELKIRNEKERNGQVVIPFSVYMKYLKPTGKKGQEAIWVKGQNNNKIVAHGTGPIQGLITVYLDPNGVLATSGTNYSIQDSGIEKLVEKLIDRATKEKNFDECKVQFFKGAKINGRSCTLIQVEHPVKRPHFEFHIARVFIDDEYQVPVRYAAWDWPVKEGGKPALLEEFTYLNLNFNAGLTAADFNHKNPKYNYRR